MVQKSQRAAETISVAPCTVIGIARRRRVAKLYRPGRYFVCRHCYRLAHASQSEDVHP
jgi:hypothetical protein